ncbi:hypothetical protein [Chlamydia vaughanii]|uniref:hypothetical protein n=1 Tax=Chlamydia vaughanii TaxID=3112552 RepID=UPI0032B172AF
MQKRNALTTIAIEIRIGKSEGGDKVKKINNPISHPRTIKPDSTVRTKETQEQVLKEACWGGGTSPGNYMHKGP